MVSLKSLKLKELLDVDWAAYFDQNAGRSMPIEDFEEEALTEAEKKLIFPTIKIFQAGEASEGGYLMQAADAYSSRTGDEPYAKAIRGFIREENRHSAYLKKYMDHYEIKPCKRSWLDACFRRIRKLSGLKSEVIVLMTAEIIALSYYSALAKCTQSPVLKAICRQMLHDELYHIVFQSTTLYKLKSFWGEKAMRAFFMEATLLAVWPKLRGVMTEGGYSFERFARESLGYLRQSYKITSFCKL